MKALAYAGIAGPVIFTVLVVVQGVLQPDYSHIRLPISALAAWPLGWIQETAFLILGLCMIAFALGLHRGIRPGKTASQGGAGAALLAMGGVGILVAGAFSVEDGRWRADGNAASRGRRDHVVRVRPGLDSCGSRGG
jgi:hypothetical membrane protein